MSVAAKPARRSVFAALLRRDVLLAVRQRADVANSLLFFVVVAAMVPLGVGPDPDALREMAPGVIWVAALLASLLSLPRLFAADYADGSLEQLLLTREPLAWLMLAKVGAHWLATGLPVVLMALPLGVMFDLPTQAAWVLAASLLLGTPVLSLLGAFGAALTLGLRAGAVLVALLVLPLTVPVLIFGSGAVLALAGGLSPASHLLLLAAFALGAVALSPWAIAAALRVSLQ